MMFGFPFFCQPRMFGFPKSRLHEILKILILQQTNEKKNIRKERLPQNCLLTKKKQKKH